MKLLNEKEFKYYRDNPGYLKYRIKEVRAAIKQCDYLIENEDKIYTLSKFESLYQIKEYKDYLICELNTIRTLKRYFERVDYYE